MRSFFIMKRLSICGVLLIGLLTGCGTEPKSDMDVLVDLGVPKKYAKVIAENTIEIEKNGNVYKVLLDTSGIDEEVPKIKDAVSHLPPSNAHGDHIIEFVEEFKGDIYGMREY